MTAYTKRYYDMSLALFMVVCTLFLLTLFTGAASAASLRVCFVNALPNPDISTAPAFLNGTPFVEDLLPGTLVGNERCTTIPIPGTIAKGIDQSFTMKYANAVGEVSAASNAKSFRLPNTPPVPIINSVSIVVP